MRSLFITLLCSWAPFGMAQSPEGFQLAIDPAGDDSVVVFADGLVTEDGGVRILGSFDSSPVPAFTLCAYDAQGQFQWGRKVASMSSGTQLQPRKLVRLASGELIVFGMWADGGSHSYFLTRMTASGQIQWTRTYRPEFVGVDYGFSSIVVTSDDQLVVSMGFIDRTVAMRLDVDGNVLWANEYVTVSSPTDKNPGFDFTATDDGGVLLTEKAEDDIFLVRLTSDGAVDWARRYPNGGYCHTHTAIMLDDGSFLICGSKDASSFAARLNDIGTMIWHKEYVLDEGNMDAFDGALELPDGDLLLTPSSSSSGIMALRLTPLGSPVFGRTIGGQGYTRVLGMHGDLVLFGGRAMVQVDNATSDAMLLLATDVDLGAACMQGSTGVTAMDIPVQPPLNGCNVAAEPIIRDTLALFINDIQFGARPLCTPIAGTVESTKGAITVYPTLIHNGEPLWIDPGMNGQVSKIEIRSSDGRLERSVPIADRSTMLQIQTNGLVSGPYLVRVMDRSGIPIRTQPVIVH